MPAAHTTLTHGNLQAKLDAAANSAQLGTAQWFTPPPLATFLAQHLPAQRRTLCDLTLGRGDLLRAAVNTSTAHLLGCDIDPAAVRAAQRAKSPSLPVSQSPRLPVSQSFHTADLTLLYPLLVESGTRFDLLTLNPPFSLQWDTARLAPLLESDCDAVADTFAIHHRPAAADAAQSAIRNPQSAIDSTLATLLIAIDRLTWPGEGYLLCNESTARRLIAPAPVMRHLWLWLTLPVGSFPGADFTPCALYFARSHEAGPREVIIPTLNL